MFTSTDFVYAKESIKLIPGGESIGIKLNTGVYIAGKYQVDTIDGKIEPWRKSDIEIGDKISLVLGEKLIKIEVLSLNEKIRKEEAYTLYKIIEENDIKPSL